MGKAVDIGNLPAAPSAGEAALMEALADISAAHDTSATPADRPPRMHANNPRLRRKTVAQLLGEIAWPVTQSRRHKAVPLGDLEVFGEMSGPAADAAAKP